MQIRSQATTDESESSREARAVRHVSVSDLSVTLTQVHIAT